MIPLNKMIDELEEEYRAFDKFSKGCKFKKNGDCVLYVAEYKPNSVGQKCGSLICPKWSEEELEVSGEGMIECPYCERNFSTQNALNSHIGQVHHDEHYEIRMCQNCGREMEVSVNSERKYCSRDCKGKAYSKEMKGKNNPFYGRHHTEEAKKKQGPPKGTEPWNKGLTAKDDDRILAGEDNPAKRPEVREKISEANKGPNPKLSRTYSGKGNPMYGKITYPKPYFVEELEHKVRSSWEEEIGLLLKNNDINYLGYEAKTFEFNGASYTPDYFISEKVIVEVKGPLYDSYKKKYQQFIQEFPEITFIIVGNAGDKPEEICNIHIPWNERKKLIGVLK